MVALIRKGTCSRFCGQCCGIHAFKGHPNYAAYKKEWQRPPFPGLTRDGLCKAFRWEKGLATCAIYETRPEICRNFPDRPSEIVTISECTYTFIPKPRPVLKKPDPVHPKLLLRWFEVWPLFDVQKTILTVPIVREGTPVRHEERVYVVIQELPDLSRRPEGIRALLEEVRRLEWKCWHQGIAGWIAGTDPANLQMQGAIVGYGARLYKKTESAYWFVYHVDQAPAMSGKDLEARSVLPSIHDIQIGAQAYVRAHVSA